MTLSSLLRLHTKIVLLIFFFSTTLNAATAQFQRIGQNNQHYSLQEIIDSGHDFFGKTTGGIATIIENIFSRYGHPNAYILGEEASGAFFLGLTYGEGRVFTKSYGRHKVFWQGPSAGFDFGGQGSRVMILVYDFNGINNFWGRYSGLSGSAYFVAGFGFHVLKREPTLLIPVRTGVGARLGINMGYLKLTGAPTWNPF